MWHSGRYFKLTEDTSGQPIRERFVFRVRLALDDIFRWLEMVCPGRYETRLLQEAEVPEVYTAVFLEFDETVDAMLFKMAFWS